MEAAECLNRPKVLETDRTPAGTAGWVVAGAAGAGERCSSFECDE